MHVYLHLVLKTCRAVENITVNQILHDRIICTVRINGFNTDCFAVKCGLKQGCPLSLVLFSFFINDLALKIKSTSVVVGCVEDTVNILLFADDIVLLAENPKDLQVLLNILNNWYKLNGMVINGTKSNTVHFRTPSLLVQKQFLMLVNLIWR